MKVMIIFFHGNKTHRLHLAQRNDTTIKHKIPLQHKPTMTASSNKPKINNE